MEERLSGLALLGLAFRNRKTGVMFAFGFAAGLPYALLLGTLYAWLGEVKVDLATIGILSWIGLAYAFKFLWSPMVDRVRLPVLERFGRRRSWLLLCQASLAGGLALLATIDPVAAIGSFALVAVLAAFAAATQDIAIDAWRIDVADDVATVGILSSVYQFGYRLAALVGGAVALVLAARIGWPAVYGSMAALMLLGLAATLLAPDTPRPEDRSDSHADPAETGADDPKGRLAALAVVALCWGWAVLTIAGFMLRVLGAAPGDPALPTAADFTKVNGPLIVVATVVVPAILAAWLNRRRATGATRGEPRAVRRPVLDHVYGALIAPLTELVGRLRWGAVIVIGLILSYRLCDAIWGPFALPFYLQELGYSNDEVAFASKIFGVLMTIAGIALGGVLFATIGRLPTLMLGAITAAASNLLYADLAAGAPTIDAVARLSGLQALAVAMGSNERMLRLLIAISGENIAGGLAGAAFVAYLSSVASRRHSAVQYALLSSLTFLIGSLGRASLGEAIETAGYAVVFRITAALGLIAVAFCALEWVRVARSERRTDPSSLAGSASG